MTEQAALFTASQKIDAVSISDLFGGIKSGGYCLQAGAAGAIAGLHWLSYKDSNVWRGSQYSIIYVWPQGA